jgi:hypothetical protein
MGCAHVRGRLRSWVRAPEPSIGSARRETALRKWASASAAHRRFGGVWPTTVDGTAVSRAGKRVGWRLAPR